jgi:hypothetical protein
MRRPAVISALIPAVVAMTVMAMAALAPDRVSAQGQGQDDGQLPQPPRGFQPPPPAPPPPVKPYKPVAVTLPGPSKDPSFPAFRKTLADIASRKDRAALAKEIVTENFFWLQDKNLADPKKPGIDNLASAIGLDNPGGSGWEVITEAAADPTLAEVPQNQGLYCAPAPPSFDPQAFTTLVQDTATDPTDWGFPTSDDVEVRAASKPDAPVVEKLGMSFVRVLPDNSGAPSFVHVAGCQDRLRRAQRADAARHRSDLLRQASQRLENRRLYRRPVPTAIAQSQGQPRDAGQAKSHRFGFKRRRPCLLAPSRSSARRQAGIGYFRLAIAATVCAVWPNRIARSSAVRMPPWPGLIFATKS